MSKRYFEGKEHADLYSKYRPTCPDIIFTTIVDFYNAGKGKTCNYELLVDVGCGSGQSSRPFCKYFRQVIGTDVSEKQIAAAQNDIANLTFRVTAGEDLDFLADSSVDVVTVACALHWLDRPAFYKEVKRILKPGGVIAAFGLFLPSLDDEDAEKCQNEFYTDILGEFWDDSIYHVRNRYSEIELPFEDFRRIENEAVSICKPMTIEAYSGWLSTLSSWGRYNKTHPDSDELTKVEKRMKAIYKRKTGEENALMNVFFPGHLLIERKPNRC